MLAQDLLNPDGFIYFCSDNIKDIYNFKLRLDQAKNALSIYESVSKISMILPSQDSFSEVYFHFTNDRIVLNN